MLALTRANASAPQPKFLSEATSAKLLNAASTDLKPDPPADVDTSVLSKAFRLKVVQGSEMAYQSTRRLWRAGGSFRLQQDHDPTAAVSLQHPWRVALVDDRIGFGTAPRT
ncbi:hypothetical protein [Methylobacterium durans]|uniref:hypothetical protein n=1 Tax=Methylobacterium durans TaxID=2202825 RepID=UPI0013A54340|nr:hypothetical protein [Methylobacterium durans]